MRPTPLPPQLCLSSRSVHVLFCALRGKCGRQRHWCESPGLFNGFSRFNVLTARSDRDFVCRRRSHQYDNRNSPVVSQEFQEDTWLVEGLRTVGAESGRSPRAGIFVSRSVSSFVAHSPSIDSNLRSIYRDNATSGGILPTQDHHGLPLLHLHHPRGPHHLRTGGDPP